jgi:hypothetical protein
MMTNKMRVVRSYQSVIVACVLVSVIGALALFTPTPAIVSASSNSSQQQMGKVFKKHEILKLNKAEIEEHVRQRKPIVIDTSQGKFELALQLHDMRSARYRAEATGPHGTVRLSDSRPVNTFKGTVRAKLTPKLDSPLMARHSRD